MASGPAIAKRVRLVMTRIEIEVFEAHRRLLAETAPDVPSALLARLEKERLRTVNRLPAPRGLDPQVLFRVRTQ